MMNHDSRGSAPGGAMRGGRRKKPRRRSFAASVLAEQARREAERPPPELPADPLAHPIGCGCGACLEARSPPGFAIGRKILDYARPSWVRQIGDRIEDRLEPAPLAPDPELLLPKPEQRKAARRRFKAGQREKAQQQGTGVAQDEAA